MQQNSDIDAKYRLAAIIEHFGNAYGGHYVTYKRLFPDESYGI